MAKGSTATLTRLELRLMQVIWHNGPGTVGSVVEQLSPPLAYTTVQTMLNILERKGYLTRKLKGRAYVYSARRSETSVLRHAVRDLVDRMFAGSPEALVTAMLRSGDLNAKAVATLARRLEREAQS